MSQNLRKEAATRASRRASSNAKPLASIYLSSTPLSSRHNTDEEDVWSETSADTADSWASVGSKNEDGVLEEINWEDEILQNIEDLGEKRTSTREGALTKLIRLLSHKYAADLLETRRDTLLDLLCRSVKKDKSYKESRLAAKVMSLLFITIGESQESMYHNVLPLLKYTITNSASKEVKRACIQTLSLSCFISASYAEAIELLNFFNDIIVTNGKNVNANNDGEVIESALNAYGLLFSGLWGDNKRGSNKAKEEFDHIMPGLTKQLESSTMEVRVASGEIIALMFESLGIGKENDTEENWGEPPDKYEDEEVDYNDMDHLIKLLNTLATDSNRHRAKAERKVQRSAFRDVLKTVESGNRVQERLKIKKQTIYFSSWAKILQLNAFRAILSEGLHVHFQENELLQAIFEFVPPPTLVPGRLRPDSALSFHTTGSDTDSSVTNKKNKKLKGKKHGKRKGDLLEVG
ncbi:interferon-related developmental regulator-domain-containing protein [Gigaspora rosea]|uniref:Interferon-related developmental regulator-domain-containing protein n=1 Tax=Gigaspora rosea TaxID=44941 RepID=A0A397UEE3_9GLOM|nr:interferon-related developmental regulator-domain-containing protein [Gigaspora rosea]